MNLVKAYLHPKDRREGKDGGMPKIKEVGVGENDYIKAERAAPCVCFVPYDTGSETFLIFNFPQISISLTNSRKNISGLAQKNRSGFPRHAGVTDVETSASALQPIAPVWE